MAQLPLMGVRVVDFGQQIAGPAVAMILADLGATVIHIDPPDGPQWDHPANAILNRNKYSIRLDLKSQEGLNKALALIEKADIVVENFRPNVMKRLGLDFVQLRLKRPDLISLSIPGFASNDELRSQWKATETIVNATSGVYTDMGFNRVLMGINPSFSPLSLASSYAATLAASSVVMALFSRGKTGRGDNIEVPLAAALMEGLSYNSIDIDSLPSRYLTMREIEIDHRRKNNIEFDLSYKELQEYLDPFFRTYECGDGRFFYVVCPSHRNHAYRCLKLLGLYDELIEEGLPEVKDLHLPISEWDGETSIGVYPLPKKWADIISKKMKKVFLTKSSAEWGIIFGEGQIPGAPHRTTKEWVNSEHCNASGLILEVDDPQFGLMKQPGPIAWLEQSATKMLSPRPCMNVSFDRAISELDKTPNTHQAMPTLEKNIPTKTQTLWLKNIKILDLTNVIAGPHSTAFLGRFGAEVIKLDPVTPMYDPLIGTLYSFQTNLGKKSALIDITTPAGREVFERLVKTVDIVVINASERQLKPLGLDHDSLKLIKSDILFCRLDCFGGPKRGPKSDYIGYDDIIQANSGIMSRFGGEQTPEEHAHIGTLDVNCGFAAGLSMALALYHKQQTGHTSLSRTSLSAVTHLAQIKFAFDYQGYVPFNEPSGRKVLGYNALSHFYKTQDGYIFIDSNESELSKLADIPGLSGILEAENLSEFLAQILAKENSEHWVNALQSSNIAAAQSIGIGKLRAQYSRSADGSVGIDRGSYAFSIYEDHPSGHKVTIIDQYAIRPEEAEIVAIHPTERLGYSTIKILAELGYKDDDISAMINSKIAGTGWGKEYLPS